MYMAADVKGQLIGVYSCLPPGGFWDQTEEVVRFGGGNAHLTAESSCLPVCFVLNYVFINYLRGVCNIF